MTLTQFPVGTDGNKAYFGRNVLRGLVDGIDDFIELRQPRWRQPRAIGPAMLASAMWIDDPELIDKLDELSGASVVVTKQVRSPRQVERMQVLQDLNDRSPGLPVRAFADLIGLGPTFDGKPTVLGPNDNLDALVVPTVRTLGYRKRGNDLVPIMHAKLALLGHLRWHDEDAFGNPDDIIWFTPQRLWISSANFTSRSRLSLEFGFWTEKIHPRRTQRAVPRYGDEVLRGTRPRVGLVRARPRSRRLRRRGVPRRTGRDALGRGRGPPLTI
jgi:hypothetical protein